MQYIPLHCHSHYSLLDGLSQPKQIAKRCLEIETSACALTDHGNIAGHVQFHQTMRKNNIKPILGCELYICEKDASIKEKDNTNSHMLVLAKNYNGWQHLIKLVSESNKPEYFYHKPRLDLDRIAPFCEDLICITGHLGSNLANKMVEEDRVAGSGEDLVAQLVEMFGKDHVFLEAQLMDLENNPIQKPLTDAIESLAHKMGVKVICTPDAHYARREDADDQRILLCNNLKTTMPEITRKLSVGDKVPVECFFSSNNFHILSQEEIREIHKEEHIENTNLVNSLIEDFDIASKPKLPPFQCPGGENPDEYLRQLCRNGWREKIHDKVDKNLYNTYTDRVKYELDVLQGADLSSYFLIVQDIVNHVREEKWLPGPGRGSAAGCLVSYLIGITSIDPIKYSLLFDRFYNAGRNTAEHISMPDIDVDVPIDKREEIIEYIKNRYGADKVSQMITFNTIKGRGALKDVFRAYGNISFEEMNKITKNIPDEAKIADELQQMREDTGEASIIRWALENVGDKLKEWCHLDDDGKIQGPLAKRFEQAIRLEGTKSNQSKHAAGIAISSEALAETCPMVYDTRNKQMIAGMEMQDLETIGVIKFDILGIAMLDKVMNISEILRQGVEK